MLQNSKQTAMVTLTSVNQFSWNPDHEIFTYHAHLIHWSPKSSEGFCCALGTPPVKQRYILLGKWTQVYLNCHWTSMTVFKFNISSIVLKQSPVHWQLHLLSFLINPSCYSISQMALSLLTSLPLRLKLVTPEKAGSGQLGKWMTAPYEENHLN